MNEEISLKWKDKILPLTAQGIGDGDGLSAILGIKGPDELKDVKFACTLNLSGSQELVFSPTGKVTSVTLKSGWPHPSFTGDLLPQTTKVASDGFTAQWKSLAFKRKYPQQWTSSSLNYNMRSEVSSATIATEVTTSSASSSSVYSAIGSSAFGAEFYIPVNAYQKTTRSVKYSFLCIVLTFAFFFIIETTNKKSVHPFQYGLIGLALVLFYTLLLSFSEYIGFNFSYLIATVCTIGLIAWFVKGVLASGRLAVVLSTVLMLTYTYVFTILQLQDYALMLGSVGLFITLGVIMYFSRKIAW